MEKGIYKASVSGSVESLKKLIEEDGGIEALAKAGFIAPSKETPPLHVAALLGHLEFAKLLLRHFPNQLTPLDSQRRTPLHYAAAAGHFLVVKEILSYDDARTAIPVPDADGNTPLHLAIMNGHLGVVNQLVSYGALEAVGYGLDGRTGKCLLHFCVMYGRLEALKSLLESREVKDDQVLAITDGDGNTVLHLAAALNQLETIKYLLKNTEVRATVNTINGQGSTALDIAQHMPMKLDSMRAEILEAIIKAGGSSASNLRDPPQTINSGVDSKEIMIMPEVEAGAVVLNLETPLTSSLSRTAAKTPPKQPARSKSMEKQLKKQRREKWLGERINTLTISAVRCRHCLPSVAESSRRHIARKCSRSHKHNERRLSCRKVGDDIQTSLPFCNLPNFKYCVVPWVYGDNYDTDERVEATGANKDTFCEHVGDNVVPFAGLSGIIWYAYITKRD